MCSRWPPQIVTGFLYHAARAPTLKKFMDIMDSNVKPFKPKVYDALVAPADKHGNPSKQQRELVKWTHHAGPPDTAIGSVVSSNAAEQNMAMVGLEVRIVCCYGLDGCRNGCLSVSSGVKAVEIILSKRNSDRVFPSTLGMASVPRCCLMTPSY